MYLNSKDNLITVNTVSRALKSETYQSRHAGTPKRAADVKSLHSSS